MAEDDDQRRSYPYMPVPNWFAVRARLKAKAPKAIDADWVASVLGVSVKSARNTVPQLRAMGLMNADGVPDDPLIDDLRADDTYAKACETILESVYPDALRDAFDANQEDPTPVEAWFMRNARTSATTARVQARLYLAIAKGTLPTAEEASQPRPKRRTGSAAAAGKKPTEAAKTPDAASTADVLRDQVKPPAHVDRHDSALHPTRPNLHIDLQIHISADAGRDQIDAVFESMAKHLYDREHRD